MGANAAGQIASVIAGGVLLALMGAGYASANTEGSSDRRGLARRASFRQLGEPSMERDQSENPSVTLGR